MKLFIAHHRQAPSPLTRQNLRNSQKAVAVELPYRNQVVSSIHAKTTSYKIWWKTSKQAKDFGKLPEASLTKRDGIGDGRRWKQLMMSFLAIVNRAALAIHKQ